MNGKSKTIVIAGGGWAGVSAAAAAKKAGLSVVLCERSDMLLGTGLVGGIMRNNGRFTASEEMSAMGGGDIFDLISHNLRHKNIEFPGHKTADLYDIALIEPSVRDFLLSIGVEIHLKTRVNNVEIIDGEIKKVFAEHFGEGETIEIPGEAFIDTTGTAGPQNNCIKYGNGCAMCIYRCPTFGSRISLAAKAGVKEIAAEKEDGTLGAMSGSCKLLKESLSSHIIDKLNKDGVCVVPIPDSLQKGTDSLLKKACQQYALKEFNENLVLLDTGHAKMMTSYYPLDILKQIPGFTNVRFEDPYSGGIGNSMRYFAMCPRDNALKVDGVNNLFCAGEKAGLLVGHTEAIVTGTLAGHNAARHALGIEPYIIPESLVCGDAIAYVNKQMLTKEGLSKKYTFSGSVYFDRMLSLDLYTTDIDKIQKRVEAANAAGVFAKALKG